MSLQSHGVPLEQAAVPGTGPSAGRKLLRENSFKVKRTGAGLWVSHGEQRGSRWEAGQSCVCWFGAAADLFIMPWAACEAADKHAGGEKRNNIEKTLLWRERCTELQLSQPPEAGQGPGSHPCCSCMALLHVLGATGIFMGLLRHQPLALLSGAAKPAGWHCESGCDSE